MCYYLYGGINKGIHIGDYKKISNTSLFFFNQGVESEIKNSIENREEKYRITKKYCDCDSALGSHNPKEKELLELAIFINLLRKVRGIKHIFISKNWSMDRTEKERTVHIDDIDINQYLADIEDNCLYKIQLFKKQF